MKAGWQTKKLGDVCQIIGGGTPSKANDEFYNGKILWATVRDMKFDMLSETEHRITEKAIKSSATNIIPKGNVVIATRVGLGKVCLLENDTAINQDLRGVVPKYKGKLSEKYLFFWFKSIAHLIEQAGTGATVHGVKLPFVKSLEIPVPPLPEQRRIVAILDEAFAGIAAAKEKAEQNLKNAKEVFTSYLKSIFADAWLNSKIVKLEDLATDITDGDHMPPPKTKEGVPFITIGNIIKETREIDFSETFMVSNEYFNGLKYSKRPVAGDILYTVTGSFGIPVLIRESKKFCFQRHIGLIRPKEKVYSEWLCYLLMSPQVVKQANEGATGTAQRTVSLSVLRNFQVPSLSLSKQKDIAGKVSDIGKETSVIESIYQQKLSNLEELKKSLLQQAFSGAL